MINVNLFSSVAYLYLVATLAYCFHCFFRLEAAGRAATGITLVGLIVHTAAYALRWFESHQLGMGHNPLSFFTLYETLVFTCWSLTIFYLVIERVFRTKSLGVFLLPFISLVMLFASSTPGLSSRIEPLPPVLQGNFLAYHVTSCMMSFAAFSIACFSSVSLLLSGRGHKTDSVTPAAHNRFPGVRTLDEIHYKTTAIGFILFSMAIATGAYRAKIIWGRYWGWDPVETASLMVWLLYALLLHGRYQRWWGTAVGAVLSLTAFVVALCSFCIAASYLMTSAHYPIR